MSKKSYKRLQNRLYREIKRRIIAEQRVTVPLNIKTFQRKIETIKFRQLIPNRFIRDGSDIFVRQRMAVEIANKLYDGRYIAFYTHEGNDDPVNDCTEIEARLDVVKPLNFERLVMKDEKGEVNSYKAIMRARTDPAEGRGDGETGGGDHGDQPGDDHADPAGGV